MATTLRKHDQPRRLGLEDGTVIQFDKDGYVTLDDDALAASIVASHRCVTVEPSPPSLPKSKKLHKEDPDA